MKKESLLVVENLTVEYETAGRRFAAVAGLNFEIQKGETLGLVAQSGCGKPSTGLASIQLPPPSVQLPKPLSKSSLMFVNQLNPAEITRSTGEPASALAPPAGF